MIPCTEEVIRSAELRFKAGNPPGKDNKLGDAINWECLLANVPNGEDLYFISSDKDYKSVIDDQRINLFLKEEWKRKKDSTIHLYVSLVSFFKANVQDIELETEQRKEDLINSLQNSSNFATTHVIISELSKLSGWSAEQIDNICSAAIYNSQVSWIIKDEDILSFYKKVLSSAEQVSENIAMVKEKIMDSETEVEDGDGEFPF